MIPWVLWALHALASPCRVRTLNRALSDERRAVSGNHSLTGGEEMGLGADSPALAGAWARPHAWHSLPGASRSPCCPRGSEPGALSSAWKMSPKVRDRASGPGAPGPGATGLRPWPRAGATPGRTCPVAMPPAGSHLLSVGGDELGRLVPQHREQPLPGRQEQHLQGLGPHVCFCSAGLPAPFIPRSPHPGDSLPPRHLHKGPSVVRCRWRFCPCVWIL